jgi:signal transduction histidine kinase
LPIAKALIELHGGELVLSSELGLGTTAMLRLPRDRVHCVASSAA